MQRDWPDIFGGLLLAILGAGAALWAAMYYDMGSLRRMGPGFFPVLLGAALFLLGLVIALPALARSAEPPKIEPATALAVLAAIVIFALSLSRLGLAGATAITVLVASLPAPRKGWVWRIVLALGVTVLTVLVFSVGLRMTLPVWPRLS
ncbi:MAG: tripartite tricarboxylate transporter TctB family protein [Roseinatronobacter sp.]|uniref:Tripartite tricarboxylate transporter TctB family protein n=1 Tax=Roseinatronobacter monicus TaxID=393481 RepID=A0A543KAU2_9RHOB|nr:tripartite tricarboxylate transporter TctB family protein [Roseinatronobacter monicus]TQM92203.1 tripartite tricarboxylate transporter TctB family protein [Roseinatronobacter monicus]TVQ04659.1 MAG: tripartite tricarboxylate transporter TctB family protein [Roseinatronobacter sp.]